MKNIIAGISTLVIVLLIWYVYNQGGAYHGGKQGKIIQNIATLSQNIAQPQKIVSDNSKDSNKSQKSKEEEALKSLKDKAGNIGTFTVSDEYKSKCASCHGVNGSGYQNGKKMMGPKIFGQSYEELYKKLADFKSGRKENVVMKGLLVPLDDNDLKRFAKEISEFKQRAKELNKNQ